MHQTAGLGQTGSEKAFHSFGLSSFGFLMGQKDGLKAFGLLGSISVLLFTLEILGMSKLVCLVFTGEPVRGFRAYFCELSAP